MLFYILLGTSSIVGLITYLFKQTYNDHNKRMITMIKYHLESLNNNIDQNNNINDIKLNVKKVTEISKLII